MINIAIDGPAGAGKSTVAKAAAKKLGYIYVDTGALYRAIGLYALRCGVDTKDFDAVSATLPFIKPQLKFIDGAQRIYLNGEDVSEAIRSPEASMAASAVSAGPKVREFLLSLQRDIAKSNNCIMDGRDIGTVVLPQATVKIFLTADVEKRAKRRFDELTAKGTEVNFDDVLNDMRQRDYDDSHRAAAPLKQAEDAVALDTGDMTLEQSIESVIKIIEERL